MSTLRSNRGSAKPEVRHWADELAAMSGSRSADLIMSQRSYAPHPKAGHMTAPAHRSSIIFSLQRRGRPHMTFRSDCALSRASHERWSNKKEAAREGRPRRVTQGG